MKKSRVGAGFALTALLALEASAVVAFKDAAKIKSWDAWKDSGATPTTWEFKERRCVTREKIMKMSSGLEPAGWLDPQVAAFYSDARFERVMKRSNELASDPSVSLRCAIELQIYVC